MATESHKQRLTVLFTDERHLPVKAMWDVYPRIVAAYRDPDRHRGRTRLITADEPD
ncbi:MAG: hypothetical protein LBG99_04175 [Propionibacteriaceae bacterium]|nr:hypothetical protein [Propionibacteriaceae bacterium]